MDHFSEQFMGAFKISLVSIGLPLSALFVLGLILAILQAATQVQDQVIGFFPKIGLCFIFIFFLGPFFVEILAEMLRESLTLTISVK